MCNIIQVDYSGVSNILAYFQSVVSTSVLQIHS